MKAQDDNINLIITKAQKLNLICQNKIDNKWNIYLKDDWVLSQGQIGWVLWIRGSREKYFSNSEILENLEKLQ